jgi:hypothetical protein
MRTVTPLSLTGAELNDPACSLAGTDRAPCTPEDEGLLTRIPGLGYYVNHGCLAEASPLGTADEYSNLSARHRPYATKAGSRPAAMTSIDLYATRSHLGGHQAAELTCDAALCSVSAPDHTADVDPS